jgi:hypothetical protein
MEKLQTSSDLRREVPIMEKLQTSSDLRREIPRVFRFTTVRDKLLKLQKPSDGSSLELLVGRRGPTLAKLPGPPEAEIDHHVKILRVRRALALCLRGPAPEICDQSIISHSSVIQRIRWYRRYTFSLSIGLPFSQQQQLLLTKKDRKTYNMI